MAGPPVGRRGPNAQDGCARSDRPGAWGAAVTLLALRPRSTREIRETLRRRGYASDEIADAVARLTTARYLDDAEFARNWVSARARRGLTGPARLARELRAKGIADVEISAAIDALAEEWDLAASADAAARRKVQSLGGVPSVVARRRLAAHLERRGFAPEIIRAMCRKHIPGGDDPAD
jgi:regulatory protein